MLKCFFYEGQNCTKVTLMLNLKFKSLTDSNDDRPPTYEKTPSTEYDPNTKMKKNEPAFH